MALAILSKTWWSTKKRGDGEGSGESSSEEVSSDSGELGAEGLPEGAEREPQFDSIAEGEPAPVSQEYINRHRPDDPFAHNEDEEEVNGNLGDDDPDDDVEDETTSNEDDRVDEGPVREDPLAPAFDLGVERRPRRERGGDDRAASPHYKSKIKSAKEFFLTEVLYRYDILEREKQQQLAGSYRVEVKGNKGGIWTMTIADELTVVNRREEADLVLTLQHRDFIAVVNGEINPQLAMLAQKVRVTGDIRRAMEIQVLLSPLSD